MNIKIKEVEKILARTIKSQNKDNDIKGNITELSKAVQLLIMNEYKKASKEHGDIHSSEYESYAIILEELEEAKAELELFEKEFQHYWEQVKANEMEKSSIFDNMLLYAAATAAEMIQVAAMCYKAEHTYLDKKYVAKE